MLELSADTTMKRVDEDNKEISMHAFELVELNKLQPNVDKHYVDAIGVISTVGNVEEKDVKGSVVKLLNLEISNITHQRIKARNDRVERSDYLHVYMCFVEIPVIESHNITSLTTT